MRDVSKFKVLDIKSDCFDVLIASFALWFKGEYGFLYDKCLSFVYDQSQQCIGEKIQVHKGDIIQTARNNGIAVEFYENIVWYELLLLVKEVNPIIIEIDGYCCPWRNTYQKLHKPHFILVFDYIEDIEQFLCVDVFPANNDLRLDIDFVLKNATRIICLSETSVGYPIARPEDYFSSILSNFDYKNKYNSIRQLEMFINDLPAIIDLKLELQGYENVDIIYCPIVWNLKSVIWSFYQFQYLLNFIFEKETKKLSEIVKRIIKNFEIVTNQIILNIIRKEYLFSTDKMKTHLACAMQEEKLLIDSLFQYCNKYKETGELY